MSTDRAELKTTRDHPDEFVEKFFCSMEKLKSHSYVAENQHKVSLSSLTYLELFCNRHWRSWKLNWKLAMWLLEVIIPYIYISIFQSLIIDENLLKDYHSVKFWSYAKSPSDPPLAKDQNITIFWHPFFTRRFFWKFFALPQGWIYVQKNLKLSTLKSGYSETVCPDQPENLQNCLSKLS